MVIKYIVYFLKPKTKNKRGKILSNVFVFFFLKVAGNMNREKK